MSIADVNLSICECDRLLKALNVTVDYDSKEMMLFKIETNQLLQQRYRIGIEHGKEKIRTALLEGICDAIKEA